MRQGETGLVGWLPWVGVAVGVVAWNLLALGGGLGEPHPTLSTLVTSVTEAPAARVLLLASWLTGGWFLVRRRAR